MSDRERDPTPRSTERRGGSGVFSGAPFRERAGLTQGGLAALAEVTTRTIIRWGNDQVDIPKLAALGIKALLTSR